MTQTPEVNEDDSTGLALLPRWNALYAVVTIVFIAYVIILYALTRTFA